MRLQQGFRQFTKVHEMNNNSSIQLNMEIDDTKLSCQQKSIMENITTAHEYCRVDCGALTNETWTVMGTRTWFLHTLHSLISLKTFQLWQLRKSNEDASQSSRSSSLSSIIKYCAMMPFNWGVQQCDISNCVTISNNNDKIGVYNKYQTNLRNF